MAAPPRNPKNEVALHFPPRLPRRAKFRYFGAKHETFLFGPSPAIATGRLGRSAAGLWPGPLPLTLGQHRICTGCLASSPLLRDSRRRLAKASTGYPVLDLELSPPIPRESSGPLEIPRRTLQARRRFQTAGSGSKSQAPDIRCLTFGFPLSAPNSRRKPRGPNGSLGKPAPVSGRPAAVPKFKHRISGA